MNLNPNTSGPEMLRKQLEAQLSLFMSVSGKLVNASLQLGELNRQASRRLLEETAADMQKALRIHTLSDAQAFFGEQSSSSLEKIRGYWQNVQAIAQQNWALELAPPAASPAEDASVAAEPAEASANEAPEQEQPHHHDPETEPPPLVQKLIATAVPPAPKPTRRA